MDFRVTKYWLGKRPKALDKLLFNGWGRLKSKKYKNYLHCFSNLLPPGGIKNPRKKKKKLMTNCISRINLFVMVLQQHVLVSVGVAIFLLTLGFFIVPSEICFAMELPTDSSPQEIGAPEKTIALPPSPSRKRIIIEMLMAALGIGFLAALILYELLVEKKIPNIFIDQFNQFLVPVPLDHPNQPKA
jgi:hypothetical protein